MVRLIREEMRSLGLRNLRSLGEEKVMFCSLYIGAPLKNSRVRNFVYILIGRNRGLDLERPMKNIVTKKKSRKKCSEMMEKVSDTSQSFFDSISK